MADVLLGRTDGIEGFERHVVLKRIKPEHARDQRFIRMFVDEARVAATLHHQHIVQVHDVGETGGEYFIAMEYLHGEDVRTILSTASKTRAHAPLGIAIAIVSAAAAGLHYAHERRGNDKRPLGIVHRDVSPSNILVGYDGSVKVVDFGIAKATMRQETRSGALKGKVSYMSPEQCRSDDIDRRSDVYSLGVVLYELATTTRLFKGENDYLVMDQIVNGRVSLPQVRRPDLPNELSTIIMHALAPDPDRRYFTADELRTALDQFANRVGITATPAQVASYMRKQFGERPEPWLELGGQGLSSFDDFQLSAGDARQHSWTELPRSDDSRRSSVAIPRMSGPISAPVSGPVAMAPIESTGTASRPGTDRAVARLPSVPPPTDSKMGWESQKPARPPRTLTPTKVAIVCTPLIALLGIAIWLLSGPGGQAAPSAVARPVAPTAPAPVVTPIPVPEPPPPAPLAPAPEPVAVAAPAPAPVHAAESPKHTAPPRRAASVAKAVEAPAPAPAKAEPPAAKVEPAPAPVAAQPVAAPSPAAIATAPAPTPPPAAPPAVAPAPTPAPAPPPPAPVAVAAAPAAPPPVEIGLPQLSQQLVERVASDHSGELAKCDGNEELHGDITVNFMIDGSGRVSKPQVATKIKKPNVISCILRVLYKFQFPKQGPGGARGSYTLTFQ